MELTLWLTTQLFRCSYALPLAIIDFVGSRTPNSLPANIVYSNHCNEVITTPMMGEK